MTQQIGDWGKQWTSIVAQAWADDNFKKRLLANPAAVLSEQGLQVPVGVRLKVVEDTDNIIHLTLPTRPGSEELAEEMLDQAVGGVLGWNIGAHSG